MGSLAWLSDVVEYTPFNAFAGAVICAIFQVHNTTGGIIEVATSCHKNLACMNLGEVRDGNYCLDYPDFRRWHPHLNLIYVWLWVIILLIQIGKRTVWVTYLLKEYF